jgi:LDH2 family malate/lactate/ureidoglycolate dehydrogenase
MCPYDRRLGIPRNHTGSAAEIAAIKATPRQDGVDEIRISRERAYRERARRQRDGIEIDRRMHDALAALAAAR